MAQELSAPLQSYGWYGGGSEERVIYWLCTGLLGSFLVVSVLLVSGVEAPYGRYNTGDVSRGAIMRVLTSWNINAKVAWILQECPTLFAAYLCWMAGDVRCTSSKGNQLVTLCFVVHYVNRSIIYPLQMKGSKPTPFLVMLMAMLFCILNGYLQCRSLTRYLIVPMNLTTGTGLLVWLVGLCINCQADAILRNLRKPGETGYKIPHGGMFQYVSGANFLGEIIEWLGFAVAMGGALPGVTFAVCTACNIGPRALTHHKWYLQKFSDEYPKDRRALIPFVL